MFSADPLVVDEERQFSALSVGGSGLTFHACALADPDGRAHCFGLNSEGQLGLAAGSGGAANSSTALAPVDTRLRFTQLTAGGAFSCGVVGGVSAASAEAAPAPRASAAAAPGSAPAPDAAPAPSSR